MAPVRIFFFVATVATLWGNTQASCITDGESPGSKSPNLTDLSDSILQYALKQYKNMITKDKYQDKNIFMSPYSIWSALMLTYLGARGPSSQEIGSLLELEGFDKSGLEEQNSKLNDLLESGTGLNVFKMANKIAFDKQVVLKKCVCDKGTPQGDPLSPLLFSLFLADLPDYLDFDGLSFPNSSVKIHLLMYADDIVLLAEDANQLQTALDCRLPKCSVSINGHDLERVPTFVYLGIVFTPQLSFTKHIERCVSKANASSLLEEVKSVDFEHNPNTERLKINKWVEDHTDGKIKNMLPVDSVSETTLITIINAVYFRGAWTYPFSGDLVFDMPFHSSNGDVNDVKMMVMDDAFIDFQIGYNHEIKIDYVDVPYKNDTHTMLLILPKSETEPIDDVVKKLTPEVVSSMWNSLNPRKILLALPKFKLELTYDLKSIWEDLGVERIFESIDLSGIVETAPPMYVSSAVHKAFIGVNEKGTEAGAATVITTSTRSGKKKLKFDRPFAFILREKSQNTVLFMGIIKNLP
ncbi:Antithrombin-III [Nymphon striatum]|nr:Antithrombin-III [Nymphon striatum]